MHDNLEEWRIDLLLSKILAELNTSLRYVAASEVVIAMFVRILKVSETAQIFMRNNKGRYRWLQTWLETRKSGVFPSGSVLMKPKRGTSAQTNNGNLSPVGSASATGIGMGTKVVGGGAGIGGLLLLVRRCFAGEPLGDSYDSDDDPTDLIGKRIKVEFHI